MIQLYLYLYIVFFRLFSQRSSFEALSPSPCSQWPGNSELMRTARRKRPREGTDLFRDTQQGKGSATRVLVLPLSKHRSQEVCVCVPSSSAHTWTPARFHRALTPPSKEGKQAQEHTGQRGDRRKTLVFRTMKMKLPGSSHWLPL